MDFLDIIRVLLLAALVWQVTYLAQQYGSYTQQLQLYNVTVVPDGIYYGDFYCVWIKDQTPSQITDTDCHEKCHALVDRQREHFCQFGEAENAPGIGP